MAIFSPEIAVRRTITIPRSVDGKDLLALIDVGGKILNKEVIYELFFKESYFMVKKQILKAYLARNGTEREFRDMLKKAETDVDNKIKKNKTVKIKKGSPGGK